jgi:cellulose synthase/poly-beta-1,6-N-acetylglucosamine synthase-like glycosyltransferase
MFAWQVLRLLVLAAQIWIALPILYLCTLSIAAILTTHRRKAQYSQSTLGEEPSSVHFAILIPAHNEEGIIDSLLASLSGLAYPKDQYSVYVVADNCTDHTAELVRATGWAQVYERFDQERRGKGYALRWLMQKLAEDHLVYDAYVILDADSVVIPTFLQAMASELQKGAQALQACYTVLNITESPSTALRWVALTLMNHVRPLGRDSLGGASTLNGNGMCFTHALLQRYPWQSFSLVDDYEYYLTLIEHGERVRYVPEAMVRSQMPTTFAQMRTQDIRWEASGGSQATWKVALRLFKAGLRHGDFARLEAIAELLTPPLSVLAFWCLFTLVFSLFVWPWPGLCMSFLLSIGLLGHIGTAFYLLRPPRTVYTALLYAPGFAMWKLWVYFVLGSVPVTGEYPIIVTRDAWAVREN